MTAPSPGSSTGSAPGSHSLFEISWEVCNKVGGIHTVISTKARTLVERYGDDYVTIGPWLLADTERELPFDEEPGFGAFAEACRQMGVPVRVGRWRIPGSPLAILVEFSGLFDQKDDVLSELWELHEVDSIEGGYDYVEPVLFGIAAARVIEKWWEDYLAPHHKRAIVHCHEWMTGSALLTLGHRIPNIGTVFTTHATMLGRALSSLGLSPEDGLGDKDPKELAKEHGVTAKHSLEGAAARGADVFTTVSEITAAEAELLHGRRPEPLLYNGIDLSVLDEMAGEAPRDEVRRTLRQLASNMVGEDLSDAVLMATSGRYEFHNKGLDLLLDAVDRMNDEAGRRVVLFFLVPAGNSGVRADLLERMANGDGGAEGPLEGSPICTHNLFDGEHDPIAEHCRALGLTNGPGSRVHVVHVPIYLEHGDGLLNLPYGAVLRAMDVTAFPSYYEPWGYTPQESLAYGVPTVTSDYAGFGRWAREQGLGPADGVTTLERVHVPYPEVTETLTRVLEAALADSRSAEGLRETCRETAARTAWSGFVGPYEQAYRTALESVADRMARGVPVRRRPQLPVAVEPTEDGTHPRLTAFDVSATLPAELAGLERLSRNYWWCWDAEARALFEELSPVSWESTRHNPVAFLRRVYPEDLEGRARDAEYVARLGRVLERFDAYLASGGGAVEAGSAISAENPVAYFCAEFGIHESLRIYSGGLGILAGDHLKSASDLGLPLIAVGLFYRMGYFGQRLTPEGEQLSSDLENDPRELPLEPVRNAEGEPLEWCLKMPGRDLWLRAWKAAVGRVTLYLLDANLPANRPEDRDITRNLYGGDHEMRLRQEIVLGRGGARLLRHLDVEPAAYHINEGHAAFLMLERVSRLVQKRGLTFEEAREVVHSTTAFTTHTPVPAGHDRFDEDLMRRYFSDADKWVGVPWERFFGLGRAGDEGTEFNMTYLALSFSAYCNGVSALHGAASRKLLHPFWPRLLQSEVPVDSITNGIHLPTWTDPAIGRLLGAEERPVRGEDFTRSASRLGDQELWDAHSAAKRRLLQLFGRRLERGFHERSDSPLLLSRMQDGLDEGALWIGFARRFAPYKRAHLLFQDLERLADLLDSEERPVRILIAGKAHPNDQLGKDILKGVVEKARSDALVGRVYFAEDYDIELGRALVQGVDVWLNNPIRMLEASGTSGMKAAANGVLNLSIGDGWWPEGYNGENGWMIADSRVYEDQALQDELDAATLYRLLEDEVVPTYFERDGAGRPTAWLERMRECLRTIPAVFDTDRMVGEYLARGYEPLSRNWRAVAPEAGGDVRPHARERARVRRGFADVRIAAVQLTDLTDLGVGESIEARVELELGSLGPEDVAVELVLGHAAQGHDLKNLTVVPLDATRPGPEGRQVFEGARPIARSGQYAYGVRVRGRLRDAPEELLPDLVRWA